MAEIVRTGCLGCGAETLRILDADTDEVLVLDPERVDGGHIAVYAFEGFAVARRYGKPARIQPAWQEHDCPAGPQPTVAPPFDPYEDEPAAAQQHGGWRQ